MVTHDKNQKLTSRLEQPLNLHQHLPFRLAVVSNLLMLNRDCAIKNSLNLGARELRVIVNVGSYMPITSAEVAYQSKLDTYTVSRAVKTLIELDLVAFELHDDNKRNKYLVLTSSGEEVYRELTDKMEQRAAALTDGMTKKEVSDLNKLLKKLEVKAESLLAENAMALLKEEGAIAAEQKELIRWHKKTVKGTTKKP